MPVGVAPDVTMVNVELKTGFAIPPFGVKMATLDGGIPLAAKETGEVELPMNDIPNLANAPAMTVLFGGWSCSPTWPVLLSVLGGMPDCGFHD